MAVPCNLVYESDKGPSREKREIVMSCSVCTIWPPDSISDGWTIIVLSVLRAIRNRPTHCPSSDHYAYVLTYTPGNTNTHYSMKKNHLALSDMGYWSPNEVHLVGSGLDGGLHRRGEGRCRGESVYLHPFITICLMAYECLHGYSRERERWMEGQRWLRSER